MLVALQINSVDSASVTESSCKLITLMSEGGTNTSGIADRGDLVLVGCMDSPGSTHAVKRCLVGIVPDKTVTLHVFIFSELITVNYIT